MKLIIDIPEEEYALCKKQWDTECLDTLMIAVKYGTPLPKGHGELIDRDKIEYLKAIHDAKYGHISWIDAIEKIKHSAPTIIEADKKESEEEE